MIYKDGKEVTAVYIAGRAIAAIRKGTLLVWEAITSCFGKGSWDNDQPWDNEDGWSN